MLNRLWANAKFFSVLACLAALVMLSLPATTLAAPFLMNYGSHMGASVTFVDVTESNNEEGPLSEALFGAPIVSGNSMDFNPVGFDAASANGINSPDVTNGELMFMVQAKPGNAVQTIKFSEIGDTTLVGTGNDATFTAVNMGGSINIHEVDGGGINAISFPFTMSFTPSGGTFGLASDGPGFTQWMGMVLVDVQQELVNRSVNFTLGATKISVNLSNILTAMSQTGTSAIISKKDAGLIVEVNGPIIPEPGSALIAVMAITLGAIFGRRIDR